MWSKLKNVITFHLPVQTLSLFLSLSFDIRLTSISYHYS